MRVDLFTTIHKGVRALLFDLAREAAAVDSSSTAAVDGLVASIERALGFLDEHAHGEDTFVFPVVRALDDALADELAAEHRGLAVIQLEVERAANALALATLSQRDEASAHLARTINHLVAVHVLHMNREETEVNATLWAGRDDAALAALRAQLRNSLPPERYAEWMALVTPALDPTEQRRLVGEPRVG